MTAGKGGEAREAEPETEGTGKVLFAEKKKVALQNMDGDMCQKEMQCTDVQRIQKDT